MFIASPFDSTGRALPFAYLETVRAEFSGKHAATPQALSAPAGGLDRAFSPRLRAAAEHLASHPEAASKVAGLQAQVDAVRSVMVENIEQVLARGERIENLVREGGFFFACFRFFFLVLVFVLRERERDNKKLNSFFLSLSRTPLFTG